MQKLKTSRNRAIVLLRKLDPEMYSFGEMKKLFKLSRQTVYDTWERDQKLYPLPKKGSL